MYNLQKSGVVKIIHAWGPGATQYPCAKSVHYLDLKKGRLTTAGKLSENRTPSSSADGKGKK